VLPPEPSSFLISSLFLLFFQVVEVCFFVHKIVNVFNKKNMQHVILLLDFSGPEVPCSTWLRSTFSCWGGEVSGLANQFFFPWIFSVAVGLGDDPELSQHDPRDITESSLAPPEDILLILYWTRKITKSGKNENAPFHGESRMDISTSHPLQILPGTYPGLFRDWKSYSYELIDELHCLVTQAAVLFKNEGRELDAEGRQHGATLRNLRLFSGRGSAQGATGRSCDERRGTRVCATHINRMHPWVKTHRQVGTNSTHRKIVPGLNTGIP
jgi:hypothetical protein